jgi:hypothetical protein
MASISDGLYSTNAYQMRLPQKMAGTKREQTKGPEGPEGPEGMEQQSVWSTWRTGGSDRVGADYPCSNDGRICAVSNAAACGRSLVLRENSVWGDVVGSADGTGYLTTNWLPPSVPKARLGFSWVSRKVVPVRSAPDASVGAPKILQDKDGQITLNSAEYAPGEVSQLFLDDKPLLHSCSGMPFLFKSEQTPFIFMVPNSIRVKTGGAEYSLDTVKAPLIEDETELGGW